MALEIKKVAVDLTKAQEALKAKNKGKKILIIPDLKGSNEIYEDAKKKGYIVVVATAKTIKGSLSGINCDLLLVANGNALYNPKTREYEFKKSLTTEQALDYSRETSIFDDSWRTVVITYESGSIVVKSPEDLERACKDHEGDIAKIALEGDSKNQKLQKAIDSLNERIKEKHNDQAIAYQTSYTNKEGQRRTRIDISGPNDKYTGFQQMLSLEAHKELRNLPVLAFGIEANDNPLRQVDPQDGKKIVRHSADNKTPRGELVFIPKSLNREEAIVKMILAELKTRASEQERC